MKTLKIFGFAVIALIILSFYQSNQKSDKSTSDIIGTFKYTGNLEGFAVYNNSHFAWTCRYKMNKPDSELTLEERYNSLFSSAGTWTMKDSIVTCTFTYDLNPKLIGTTLRWVYDKKGNEFNYRTIDQDGKITGTGSCVKIK